MLKNHDLQLTQRYIMVPSLVGHGLIEICDETMESSLGRMYRMTTCKVFFFFKQTFILFIYFWLPWVLVAALGGALVAPF